ncbi:hypothetical protein Poli38472_003045 [Pythium oligandrum]|uniref:Kinetochore protein Spc24 n=1 Tax=Pythium oligandrum TaxID=41045 RepID=A0A8K1FBC8_PYTOL|nr:hypothetical protein Poli38472_003045 [Pythium oligandrum]|eukprot:TMW57120.1 hypothetical protein Poli38472_003045 [Pythium oligandrum]
MATTEMESKLQEHSLSWREVQEICGEMETLFRKDAQKDAQRLRSLIQKRKEIMTTTQTKRSEANRQLSRTAFALRDLLTNVGEWEEQTNAANARKDKLNAKLLELDALKREMLAQLERLRVDEQSSKENLDQLLEQYELTRQQVVQYELEQRQEVDRAKHFMSLYAAVTGIKWDFRGGDALAGEIHVPHTKQIVPFEVPSSVNAFATTNQLWDKIDEAFADVDTEL